MRLLLDEHVSPAVLRELCRRGHDVVAATEAGLDGMSDTELFRWARRERRAVVTGDRGFRVHHQRTIARAEQHFGLILVPRREWLTGAGIGRLVRALGALLCAYPADDALDTCERWLADHD